MLTFTTSDRLAGLKQELQEIKSGNLQYWAKSVRSDLDKTGYAMRRERLLVIKQEFSEMLKRGAS